MLHKLWAIHQVGVLHGDFAAYDVILISNNPTIIDFLHASLDHHCPEPFKCKELAADLSRAISEHHTVNSINCGFQTQMSAIGPSQ